LRFRVIGSVLSAKIWLASSSEPVAWNLTIADSFLTSSGSVGVRSLRNTGNTNANLLVSFDSIQVNLINTVTNDIECWVRTKNFDMAISHQFKRLWWWGADVSTSRTITGIATPVIVSFQVYWGQLLSMYWGQLLDDFWGQPLTEPTVISTPVTTTSGAHRRFAKFLKGLRYRQINFKVLLITQGSTLDGPARLFTMTILTETRQVVPKSVN